MHAIKTFVIVAVLVTLLYGAFLYFKPAALSAEIVPYRLPDTSLTLAYRTNPDGYRLDTFTRRTDDDPTFVSAAVLLRKSDYDQLGNSAPREGPPTIMVAAYRIDAAQSPRAWAEQYPQFSNLPLLIGERSDSTIVGAPALRYTIDGLYRTNMALVAHNGFMYVFAGAYVEENSSLQRDLETILQSITWK
jgi:hypothetical protein